PGSALGVAEPGPQRLFALYGALLDGHSAQTLAAQTGIDCWFLEHMAQIAALETALARSAAAVPADRAVVGDGGTATVAADAATELLATALPAHTIWRAKSYGFSDHQLARICHV